MTPRRMTTRINKAFRMLLALGACALLAWVVTRNLPLDGRLRVSVAAAESSGFIGGFQPATRAEVMKDKDGVWETRVTGDPAYFMMAAPSFYRTATVRLRYRNEGQPVVELGARTSLKEWQFDLEPLDAPFLEELDAHGWTIRQDGAYRVYERVPTGRSAQEILDASEDRVGVYHADPVRWHLHLPGERAESLRSFSALSAPWRPGLPAYLYWPGGNLDLRLEGIGLTKARLVHESRTVLERPADAGRAGVSLELSNAAPGVYRLETEGDADATVSTVRTNARKLVIAEGGSFHQAWEGSDFRPEFVQVNRSDMSKTDTIVARLAPPAADADGWSVAEATFDLSALAADRGRVQMALSLPAVASHSAPVRVRSVEVEYRRPAWSLEAFLSALRNRFERLRSRL